MKIFNYLKYTLAKKNGSYDYSWVALILPKDISEKIIKFGEKIPDRELYTEEDSHGREDEPHITIKYGILTKDARKVKKLLEDEKGGKIKLNIISSFENEKYDVLKISIISPALRRLNKKISDNLECHDSFPDYNPHSTIAYLKCGNAVKYCDKYKDEFKNIEVEFNEIIFKRSDTKEITKIKLKD
jgi:2'-5' RNA ligase